MAGDPKNVVAAAITRAQTDLSQALSELENIANLGQCTVRYAAHALNNYLTVSRAAAQLISRRLPAHPDEQVTAWLDGLVHATEMMASIVAQLMSASASTDARLRFEKVDLMPALQRFCDFYEQAAIRKSIRLIIDPAVDVPFAWTDRVALASVIDNVLSNAIKYSPPGKRVWLGIRGEKDGIVCEVRDEGPGLDEPDQARLFQKGARLTPTPTGGESSTGYGLAVAKDLMEKLGGQIWCESVLGQGTRFYIRVPAWREPAPGPAVVESD